jgi:exonuclease III
MVALKLMTLNTGNSRLLGGLLAIIRIENPDIVFLQELTLTSGQLKLFVAKFGYSAEANTNLLDITELGTGMIWKSHIPVSDVTSVVQSRIQMAKLGPYTLLNIYAPSGSNHRQERRDFFGQDIFNLVRGSSSFPLIAGDFNCVLSAQDTERNFSDKKCPALTDLVRGFNYADAFRIVKPNAVEFTFHRPKCAASRLDRFYVPQYLLPHVQDVHHHASLSDHHYGILELELASLESVSPPPRSKQLYWKLNTNTLQDEDFMENFTDLYNKVKSEMASYEDIAAWWDCVAKPAFKHFCMDVSERLSYIRKNTKMYLFSYLGLVIRKGNWKEVARVRKEIKTMLEKESMGFVVRSRYKESIESEKASVFHLNRENKNYKKNSLKSLKINGEVTTDESKIEAEVLKYLGALLNGHHDRNGEDTGQPFVPDYTELPDFLSNLTKLSQESQDSLIKNLTSDQVKFVIFKKCERNKSPGLDGLPYEFYQVTWEIIGEDFVKVLQCQLDRVRLVESDRHGATRLTSKVDGIPAVSELRPITLLNCDYKILSKCFVGLLTPVMGEIISSGQLCSVKDKNILFGISNITSSLDYIIAHNIPAYLASFDMFKAYDMTG